MVCFPGIFYRGGAEKKIRQYLVDMNYVECVIALPPNLFYGTSIAVNILTLSKKKSDTQIRFIDASSDDFFKKETNNNVLLDEHIEKIIKLFASRKDGSLSAVSIDQEAIREQDYNLSVSSYVEAQDTREVINIDQLNAQIKKTVERINSLRSDIDTIITELEA